MASEPADFQGALREAARRIGRSALNLTREEKQLLQDVQRGRYQMRCLQQLLQIASRCAAIADAFALEELCRREVVRRHCGLQTPTIGEAFEAETRAQCVGDLAQFGYWRAPSSTTRDHAIEALTGHITWGRIAVDALHRETRPLALVR